MQASILMRSLSVLLSASTYAALTAANAASTSLPCLSPVGCVRAARCDGQWANVSGVPVWQPSSAACRYFIETGGEAAVALAGRTITFIGDSVVSHVVETTLQTLLGGALSHGPPSWKAMTEGARDALEWRYSPKNRHAQTFVLGDALGGMTWRVRWTSLLRWFWDDSPNDQYRGALLAWKELFETPSGEGDFIVIAVSAWYLASYSSHLGPEALIADVNRTIAALDATPVGTRRRASRCVFWLSLAHPETMGNDGAHFTLLTHPPVRDRVDALWEAAGYPVIRTEHIARWSEWARRAPGRNPDGNFLTKDGLHYVDAVEFEIGKTRAVHLVGAGSCVEQRTCHLCTRGCYCQG